MCLLYQYQLLYCVYLLMSFHAYAFWHPIRYLWALIHNVLLLKIHCKQKNGQFCLLAFLKELGRRIRGETEPKSTEYLVQRLSVAVQRGNCVAVLGSTGY